MAHRDCDDETAKCGRIFTSICSGAMRTHISRTRLPTHSAFFSVQLCRETPRRNTSCTAVVAMTDHIHILSAIYRIIDGYTEFPPSLEMATYGLLPRGISNFTIIIVRMNTRPSPFYANSLYWKVTTSGHR